MTTSKCETATSRCGWFRKRDGETMYRHARQASSLEETYHRDSIIGCEISTDMIYNLGRTVSSWITWQEESSLTFWKASDSSRHIISRFIGRSIQIWFDTMQRSSLNWVQWVREPRHPFCRPASDNHGDNTVKIGVNVSHMKSALSIVFSNVAAVG